MLSALPPIATDERTSQYSRFLPRTDVRERRTQRGGVTVAIEVFPARQKADAHLPPIFSRSSTTRLMSDPMSTSWKPSSTHICSMVVFSTNTSPYTRRRPFSLA
jgi:hypothetical protein